MSEVLGNKDYRVDSQFWTTVITKNQQYKYVKIGDTLKQTQYGISLDMNEDGIGYPIYRMNEIHNSICDLDVKKYANITPLELSVFVLQDGDILFNRTNSYEWVGRTGIYYKTHEQEQKVFASYLVRLIPDTEQILPEYLTAYLNTSFGIRQIKARARQSINQTNVNPEEVKEIEIPLLCKSLQTAIQCNYKTAHKNLITAKTLYRQAEEVLNEYLQVGDIAQENACSVKNISDSFLASGRLDAEYYQPKYDRYKETIENSNYALINDYFDLVANKCVFNLEKYKYIEIGDINVGNGSYEYNIVNTENLPANARIMTKKGDILVSTVRPNRGAVTILEEDDLLVSGAFTVLRQKGGYQKELLQLLLRTTLYRDWLLKFNVGTSYPVIKDSDVLFLPIPIINESTQKEIAEKVQESFRLRKESKRLLDSAIKAVEMAIETDEETALQWLKEQNRK